MNVAATKAHYLSLIHSHQRFDRGKAARLVNIFSPWPYDGAGA